MPKVHKWTHSGDAKDRSSISFPSNFSLILSLLLSSMTRRCAFVRMDDGASDPIAYFHLPARCYHPFHPLLSESTPQCARLVSTSAYYEAKKVNFETSDWSESGSNFLLPVDWGNHQWKWIVLSTRIARTREELCNSLTRPWKNCDADGEISSCRQKGRYLLDWVKIYGGETWNDSRKMYHTLIWQLKSING